MDRVLCVLIGYVFGLFQSGYIYGRMNGIDIRTQGSGNSGTTNALRVLGKKAGLIVFLGDVCKLWLACLLTAMLFNGGALREGMGQLLVLYTAWGVVLGHNYPFYMHFHGGKGIAVTAGLVVVLDWRLMGIVAAVFLITVILTRYVSLGSILVVISFLLVWLALGLTGRLALPAEYFTESCILVFCWMVQAVWRHRTNIGRLLSGTENKLF